MRHEHEAFKVKNDRRSEAATSSEIWLDSAAAAAFSASVFASAAIIAAAVLSIVGYSVKRGEKAFTFERMNTSEQTDTAVSSPGPAIAAEKGGELEHKTLKLLEALRFFNQKERNYGKPPAPYRDRGSGGQSR